MKSLKILVIDNTWEDIDKILSVSKAEGHNPFVKVNFSDALNWLSSDLPDIIFLDMDMPGRCSLDLIDILAMDPKYSKIPIVLMVREGGILPEEMESLKPRLTVVKTPVVKGQIYEVFQKHIG